MHILVSIRFQPLQTFNVNEQTPDSASTATAIYSGIKTLSDTLGFDSSIIYDNATSMLIANKVETIFTWAQEAGKDTGKCQENPSNH